MASPKYDVFEGLPDNQVDGQFLNRFGGNDDDDSSGVLRCGEITLLPADAFDRLKGGRDFGGIVLTAAGGGDRK